MSQDTITRWHDIVHSKDLRALDELLSDDVVFHSPVVFSPQRGKALTLMYLAAAIRVLGNDTFHYVSEACSEAHAVLEFEAEVDGVTINGIDKISWDSDGRIVDFKVMLRPLKAVNHMHELMRSMLAKMSGRESA